MHGDFLELVRILLYRNCGFKIKICIFYIIHLQTTCFIHNSLYNYVKERNDDPLHSTHNSNADKHNMYMCNNQLQCKF